eukprot:6587698-Heterocapsa_arctica.AAC.1
MSMAASSPGAFCSMARADCMHSRVLIGACCLGSLVSHFLRSWRSGRSGVWAQTPDGARAS